MYKSSSDYNAFSLSEDLRQLSDVKGEISIILCTPTVFGRR